MIVECYEKDYPRPQLSRGKDSWLNLNGKWNFAFDDDQKGKEEKWYNKFNKQMEITVPFTYETKASGINDQTLHNVVWYNRTVNLDKSKVDSKDVYIIFEGSDYVTDVWVNGNYAGSHTGGYSRFEFDITPLVKCGENTITVRVLDLADERQQRGKQRWQKENFGCWYVETTGIWKTVWIEYRPATHIVSLKMTPDLSNSCLNIEAEISGDISDVSLKASASFAGIDVGMTTVAATSNRIFAVVNVFSTKSDEWGVKIWTPQSPNLYDIKFSLFCKEDICDYVTSYFGMREVGIDGNMVTLNGEPIYQRLILDQGYWHDSHLTPPSEEALIADIDKIHELGYNGLRKHQKVEDERFLYWCDVKGMLVWSEFAASYLFDDVVAEHFTTEWMAVVRQNYNHPSIITWTPFNESWGVKHIKTQVQQQHFTEAIYYLTKAFDKNRPVIVNDGWEHTISDIITLHDYEEQGDIFFERYINYKDQILSNTFCHNGVKKAFADGYAYKGQPIIISEYGGIAYNNDDSGWGYGNKVNDEAEFLKRFDSITTAIKKLPYCCGYCYTQVTDVQQEINGLMDEKRTFKVNPEKVREINLK